MSSPLSGGATESGLSAGDLPGPDPAWMESLLALATTQTTTREATIERKVEQYRLLAGSVEPFDVDAQRKIARHRG